MRRAIVAALSLSGCVAAPAPPPPPVQAPAPPPPLPLPPLPSLRVPERAIQGGLVRGQAPPGTSRLILTAGSTSVEVPVAADGAFIVGFDRDAGPVATLVATLGPGRGAEAQIAVAPRAWAIERVDAPYRAGRSSAEFERLRPLELAELAAARTTPTVADGWRQPLHWPATGRVSGLFGAQRIYRGQPGSYHSGVDIALPTGAPVIAPADGVVTLAATRAFTLEGRLLLIDHGGGLESAFLHLSRIDVGVGQRVRAGQAIGLVGATGRATGPHLHWALRWRGSRLDPLLVAGPMPTVP